ncbi:MAG TPA: hypothetical protein PLG73_12565 [Candidatus Sumerlaeota bacterium]|nr:hypothetical protein [Candidatus Sumerlaeota bacterium]
MGGSAVPRAEHLDEEKEQRLRRTCVEAEPLILVVLGVAIGSIALRCCCRCRR